MIRKTMLIALMMIMLPLAAYAADGCGGCGVKAGECPHMAADWTIAEVEGGFDVEASIPGCARRSANIRQKLAETLQGCQKGECKQACACKGECECKGECKCKGKIDCADCAFKTEDITLEIANGDKTLKVMVRSDSKDKLAEFKTKFDKRYITAPAGKKAGCGCAGK
jgi:predicted outer membrane protein